SAAGLLWSSWCGPRVRGSGALRPPLAEPGQGANRPRSPAPPAEPAAPPPPPPRPPPPPGPAPRLGELSSQPPLPLGHGRLALLQGPGQAPAPVGGRLEQVLSQRLGGEAVRGPRRPPHHAHADGRPHAEPHQAPEDALHRVIA